MLEEKLKMEDDLQKTTEALEMEKRAHTVEVSALGTRGVVGYRLLGLLGL